MQMVAACKHLRGSLKLQEELLAFKGTARDLVNDQRLINLAMQL